MKLKVFKSEAADGNVVIYLSDTDGNSFTLPLTVFDVSTLVSMLYASRDDALKQARNTAPEVLLPMEGLSFGQDNTGRQILRVHTTPVLHQDFSPAPGTTGDQMLREVSDFLAKRSSQAPVPWGKPSKKH